MINTGDFSVYCVAWSPNGEYLAVILGNWRVVVDVLDTRIWEAIRLPEVRAIGNAIAWSPDSRYLAWASDKDITIWDAESWELIKRIEANAPYSLAWSPYGRFLANDSLGRVEVRDTLTWELVGRSPEYRICISDDEGVEEEYSVVWSLAWSPDGRFLAAGFDDGYVRVWAIRLNESAIHH